MKEIRKIIELYDRFVESGTACALATVVNIEGSSYRRIGARLLVGEDGRFTGGISGGCLEGDALRRARQSILHGAPTRRVYDTLDGEDEVIGIGLGCNGRIEVNFVPLSFEDPQNQVEVLRGYTSTRQPVTLRQPLSGTGTGALTPVVNPQRPPGRIGSYVVEEAGVQYLYELLQPELHLVTLGDNYDAVSLATAAHHLGWRVTVLGLQRKFTTALAAVANQLSDYADLDRVELDDYTAVVCLSHDYARDLSALKYLLPRQPVYLGLLGPRKRTLKLHNELWTVGLDLMGYPNLYAPVGLDIGAETPEEIAAAVVGEILAVFRERGGGPLREGSGGIH